MTRLLVSNITGMLNHVVCNDQLVDMSELCHSFPVDDTCAIRYTHVEREVCGWITDVQGLWKRMGWDGAPSALPMNDCGCGLMYKECGKGWNVDGDVCSWEVLVRISITIIHILFTNFL